MDNSNRGEPAWEFPLAFTGRLEACFFATIAILACPSPAWTSESCAQLAAQEAFYSDGIPQSPLDNQSETIAAVRAIEANLWSDAVLGAKCRNSRNGS